MCIHKYIKRFNGESTYQIKKGLKYFFPVNMVKLWC